MAVDRSQEVDATSTQQEGGNSLTTSGSSPKECTCEASLAFLKVYVLGRFSAVGPVHSRVSGSPRGQNIVGTKSLQVLQDDLSCKTANESISVYSLAAVR